MVGACNPGGCRITLAGRGWRIGVTGVLPIAGLVRGEHIAVTGVSTIARPKQAGHTAVTGVSTITQAKRAGHTNITGVSTITQPKQAGHTNITGKSTSTAQPKRDKHKKRGTRKVHDRLLKHLYSPKQNKTNYESHSHSKTTTLTITQNNSLTYRYLESKSSPYRQPLNIVVDSFLYQPHQAYQLK